MGVVQSCPGQGRRPAFVCLQNKQNPGGTPNARHREGDTTHAWPIVRKSTGSQGPGRRVPSGATHSLRPRPRLQRPGGWKPCGDDGCHPHLRTVHALGPVDLELRRGEFFSIVGPSGCGKSTLLDGLAGLSSPTDGIITFEGKRVRGTVPDGVGVVFQEDASFPWLSVRDNIGFGLRRAGFRGAEADDRVRHAIDFMGLNDFADADPNQLSGGMRQRVCIARTLVMRPDACGDEGHRAGLTGASSAVVEATAEAPPQARHRRRCWESERCRERAGRHRHGFVFSRFNGRSGPTPEAGKLMYGYKSCTSGQKLPLHGTNIS
ncbi:ABC transporter ATP-binding protein [Azospirillum brasilense]|uniref:ATP-binding cassette domain-containing protein n=1 Tax=Azospirillum brasilense TaxID=192 RepID=A0A6L3B141_AZOBR|nr:ATP-binding cassette domain-containing protein [Azospirillum brasilense]KAA0684436.1 ATP-binding cassette domain-containing protein [Azospirillum brasilense]